MLREVRLGAIEALRGLALYGTVLSCPVSLCRARLFEVLYGMAEWSPVRLGQVEFGSVRRGISWRGLVLLGGPRRSGALP